MSEKYRLITRSDLDGIVCASLLKELDMIDEIKFAHPKDMQDGMIEVGSRDIVTNLPYQPKAGMVFDHHASEVERLREHHPNLVNDPTAPSAAHVVYRHFGGAEKFPNISKDLLEGTNKVDSGQLSMEDILDPKGWVLLGFIMDSRTGLGRFHNFRVSNYQLMMDLIDILRKEKNIDDILKHPDVAERVKMYKDHAKLARQQIMNRAEVHNRLLVLDFRRDKEIYTTNRFTIYAMYPQCNVSMHILPGKMNQNTVFAVGKSVLNRSAKVDIGSLMLEYGGGGHKAVGTCQIAHERVDEVKAALIKRIVEGG